MPTLFSICAQQRRRGGAFDADAADYFERAEALGGSFDQTAINATYTEAYVKGAISDCITALKTDAVWDKITELYLLAGVSFGGLMAKVKHAGTAVTTNNGPFVAGDYLAAGSGAGLIDGSGKKLTTGIVFPASHSMGFYLINNDGSANGRLMGSANAAEGGARFQTAPGPIISFLGGPHATGAISTPDSGIGMLIGNAANNAQSLYSNGDFVGSLTETRAAISTTFELLGVNGLAGDTSCRQSMAFYGDVLNATEAANLSLAINGLMTALGCNVYANP